ncbi:MAG TPA: aminotransferase class III-fold pyridoxal phosphate-dependent enzyme [Solirubrobacteraceae bacterium]|nr:aminotransferase class III-fold pyridoxal phosphate-dependent enzyme [Solirubrobacteraceae bacterium]
MSTDAQQLTGADRLDGADHDATMAALQRRITTHEMTAEEHYDRDAIVDVYRRHISRGRASLSDLSAAPLELRSAGSTIFAADGTEYLDFGGYGVFILGHCHPAVVEAVVAQVRRHPVQSNVLVDPLQASAAAALLEVVPSELDCLRFTNSGAESAEFALKLARRHGKRHIINTARGFHGKTLGALSATANPIYQEPFGPLFPSDTAAYGDAKDLRGLLSGRDDCCVILEPIQGEGGVIIPPKGYLTEVVSICKQHDALLIFDEIQSGLGRTGRWWAAERDGAIPDVMLIGKGLSGGVIPVAAVVATNAVYKPFSEDPMLHSSTFAGSPVAAAAARAAVRAIAAEGLVERAATLGKQLLSIVTEVAGETPQLVRDVRGEGLLIGIEFAEPSLVTEMMMELLGREIIVNHSFNAHTVLRLTPSALLTDAQIERFAEALGASLRAVAATY